MVVGPQTFTRSHLKTHPRAPALSVSQAMAPISPVCLHRRRLCGRKCFLHPWPNPFGDFLTKPSSQASTGAPQKKPAVRSPISGCQGADPPAPGAAGAPIFVDGMNRAGCFQGTCLEISKHPGHFYGVKAVNSGTGVKTPEGSCFEGQSRTIECSWRYG